MPSTCIVLETVPAGWTEVSKPGPITLVCASNTTANFVNQELLCINGTKTRSCDGAAVAGTKITLYKDSVEVANTTTGADGKYSFCGLMPGNYTVKETVPAGWTEVSKPGPITLVCASNTTANFVNQELLCINGTKTRSCDGAAVAGTKITLYKDSVEVANTTTGADGKYSFCGLMPGNYTVKETVPAGWTEVSKPGPITLVCASNTTANFVNQELLCINGTKTRSCDGAAVAGTKITLYKDSVEVANTTTGADGKYSFCGLMPGNYTVKETVPAGWTEVSKPGPITLVCASNTTANFVNQELLCINGTKTRSCDGTAVAGTKITLYKDSVEVANTTTGSDGKYSFCGLMPGTYTVQETVPAGWTEVSKPGPITLVCASNTTANFVNQELLCINGTKTRSCDGAAVAGTKITLYKDSVEVANTTTGADGKYSFCGLMPGTYTVQETVPAGWTEVSKPGPITLVCASNTTANFVNQELLCINGTKIDDCTGEGLNGWTITLTKPDGSTSTAKTADGGKYSFCGLMPGTYKVEETVDAGWMNVTPTSRTVTLDCLNVTGQDFTNQKLLCINGTKIDDCTGEGLNGWTITLTKPDGSTSTAKTADGGKYSFCGLMPGTYKVEETVDAGWMNVTPTSRTVTLDCLNVTGQDFTNQKLLCINGTKIDDCTGEGLNGWTITLTKPDGSTSTAKTADGGKYSFCGLMPGTYKVEETVEAGWMNVTPTSRTVTLDCLNVTGQDFTNQKLLCINGTKIDDCTGEGLNGWTITLTKPDGSTSTAKTADGGKYSFCGLMPGTYKVEETVEAGWMNVTPTSRTVTLDCLNVTGQDFTNQKLLCINGTKIDDCTGEGLNGWTITLTKPDGSTSTAKTADGGKYSFCGLMPGTYKVEETVEAGWMNVTPTSRTVTLDCLNVTGQDFTNQKLLCINGTKIDDCTGEGLNGWTITLTKPDGSTSTAKTADGGKYSFCGLMPGTYKVEETVDAGWMNVTPTSRTVTLDCLNVTGQDFTNQKLLCINGTKIDDCTGEGLNGWTITLTKPDGSTSTAKTADGGKYSFCGLMPGTYKVEETVEAGWMNVTPTSRTVTLDCNNVTGQDFINQKL